MQITSPKAGRFIHMYVRWSYTMLSIYSNVEESKQNFILGGDLTALGSIFVASLLSNFLHSVHKDAVLILFPYA